MDNKSELDNKLNEEFLKAVEQKDLKKVGELLQQGADISYSNKEGENAFHILGRVGEFIDYNDPGQQTVLHRLYEALDSYVENQTGINASAIRAGRGGELDDIQLNPLTVSWKGVMNKGNKDGKTPTVVAHETHLENEREDLSFDYYNHGGEDEPLTKAPPAPEAPRPKFM